MASLQPNISDKVACSHCGEPCPDHSHQFDGHSFCCAGCLTVYQLINASNLSEFYANGPVGQRTSLQSAPNDLDFLDNKAVKTAFLQFSDGKHARVEFSIPSIHCSSCVYLLERLPKLEPNIISSQVNFPQKKVSILFSATNISLKEVAALLIRLGFTPELDLAKLEKDKEAPTTDKKLLYKLGVAGFCFGNIMLLSFPEYLSGLGIDGQFSAFFNWLNLLLALPVLLYAGSDYLISAYKGLRISRVNMDVPISMGMLAIFLRSAYEIISGTGPGFMDSLSGFVFFLLIGKWYQAKTYAALSFERDYRSFFPIAVRKILSDGTTVSTLIKDLKKGDAIQLRNAELIPTDALLDSEMTQIDYSFVTGEADPVTIVRNERIFAGGRLVGTMAQMKVLNEVETSYLTSLWAQHTSSDQKPDTLSLLSDRIASYFSIAVISIALITGIYWGFADSSKWLNAVSSVLIIACPCALALSIPFTYGTLLRYFGRNGLFLRSISAIGQMTNIDSVAFDKTGTITTKQDNDCRWSGESLSERELNAVINVARQSAHPLSRRLASVYSNLKQAPVSNFLEETGKGITATINGLSLKVGSADMVGDTRPEINTRTGISIAINGVVKGRFSFGNKYRKELQKVILRLQQHAEVSLLSGDNDAERERLNSMFKGSQNLHFNMRPHQKKEWILNLQNSHRSVMMVGDGLNDAGALAQANLGVSIADDIHQFTPASDAILQSGSFEKLPDFLLLAKDGKRIVKAAFVISLFYNIAGITIAAQGILTPVFAAIFMPLSSVSIVLFTTLVSGIMARVRLSNR
ncbi:MAG: heavy metal translocating P-type ATPase metal-binding domain-containing protein [Flavobacteriales bacterium]|nr:heavy metal translocating P-type ATPase metal-binding domain-containing protein [Flavobacteriales bacterium]